MDESYFGFGVGSQGSVGGSESVESPAEETEEDEGEFVGRKEPLTSYGLPLEVGGDEPKSRGDSGKMAMESSAGTAVSTDAPVIPESTLPTLTALDELLAEMGYLGNMITN